jgi:phenylalanine-4-hydroxylase
MNTKYTKYKAKKPDASGYIHYTEEEHHTWNTLMCRQRQYVQNKACEAFFEGLERLQFPLDRIPQLDEVNQQLSKSTDWQVVAVPALINFDRFFNLLANKRFPAATFIRTPEDLHYLQEPDIFHELFGHCPMLTNGACADFTARYAKLGVNAPPFIQKMLARLYWFTIEFGLIETPAGLRIYGGGILSSIGETEYSLWDPTPERKPFDTLAVLRTPYRIDIYQTVYYILHDFNQLYDITQVHIEQCIADAKRLGEFPPTFPPKLT